MSIDKLQQLKSRAPLLDRSSVGYYTDYIVRS